MNSLYMDGLRVNSRSDATIGALRSEVARQISAVITRDGATQTDTATRLGVPQPTLSKIVNGRVSDLSLELLIRVAAKAGLAIALRPASEANDDVLPTLRRAPRPLRSETSAASRASHLEAARRLTPSQRMEAFLEHNQLLAALHRARREAGIAPGAAAQPVRTERPGQSALLLLDAVDVLRREAIEYLVIGAFALSVHGVIRGSTHVDALLYISERRLAKLRNVFKQAGLEATLRRGDADHPIPIWLVLTDTHANQVDLLGGLRGLDPLVFSRAVDVPFLGENLRVVGLEDFIAMKCFAGGPQDLIDARSAYHAAQAPVDLDLLRAVASRFGTEAADRLERLLSE